MKFPAWTRIDANVKPGSRIDMDDSEKVYYTSCKRHASHFTTQNLFFRRCLNPTHCFSPRQCWGNTKHGSNLIKGIHLRHHCYQSNRPGGYFRSQRWLLKDKIRCHVTRMIDEVPSQGSKASMPKARLFLQCATIAITLQ